MLFTGKEEACFIRQPSVQCPHCGWPSSGVPGGSREGAGQGHDTRRAGRPRGELPTWWGPWHPREAPGARAPV